MRKTAAEKVSKAAQKARAAADRINGYGYIKTELMKMAGALDAASVTLDLLDDFEFSLQIILLAADTDVQRSGGRDKEMFGGIQEFKNSLQEAMDFVQTLPAPVPETPSTGIFKKVLIDIAFQTNLLFFFTRGEGEKLGDLLDEKQKAAFEAIYNKINDVIELSRGGDETVFGRLTGMVFEIRESILTEADQLNERGGALRYIAHEMKNLGDKIAECEKNAADVKKQ
jgi:hypothetical protein